MKISEIIDKIKAYHPPVNEERTTDVVKFGNIDQECSGVAVTCFASCDVIRKAAEAGANLIIVHEPLFWKHEDTSDWCGDMELYQQKAALLDEYGMVVFRDHDRIHASPKVEDREFMDGIFEGICKELGWEDFVINYPNKPLVYEFPEARDGEELGRELIQKIGLKGIRIVGDRHTKVKKVYLCEHLGNMDRSIDQKIRACEFEQYDAVIPLEMIDWTLPAYIRDSCQMGVPKIMYNIGHFNLEELGMRHMARWLPDVIGGDVPVTYIQSGDSFDFI